MRLPQKIENILTEEQRHAYNNAELKDWNKDPFWLRFDTFEIGNFSIYGLHPRKKYALISILDPTIADIDEYIATNNTIDPPNASLPPKHKILELIRKHGGTGKGWTVDRLATVLTIDTPIPGHSMSLIENGRFALVTVDKPEEIKNPILYQEKLDELINDFIRTAVLVENTLVEEPDVADEELLDALEKMSR